MNGVTLCGFMLPLMIMVLGLSFLVKEMVEEKEDLLCGFTLVIPTGFILCGETLLMVK